MKRAPSIILCLILLLILTVPCSAHPGSLDSNGGHWNHSTGEYHYHDGTATSGSPNKNTSSSTAQKDWADDDPAFELTFGHVVLVLLLFLPIGLAIWTHFPTRYDNTLKNEQPPKSNIPPAAPRTPTPSKKPSAAPSNAAPSAYKRAYRVQRSRPRLSKKPRTILVETDPNASATFDPAFFTPVKQKQFERSIKTDRFEKALNENITLKDIRQERSTKPITVSCRTISKDGATYNTTLTNCDCPDCENRHVVCKHMILLAIKVNAMTIDAPPLETSADKEMIALMENANDSVDNDLPF
ncbi:MAG: YHYH domain-containing protein [Clostridia bacterium]|nr:YHYH domain-containing protein [Clostridia bacterium]